MLYESQDDLVQAVYDELEEELNSTPDSALFNGTALKSKVRDAVREIRMKRAYENTSYTEQKILNDLGVYFSAIKNLARIEYNMIGSEGESTHTEGDVSRSYKTRSEILQGVHAFVKLL